MLSDFGTEGALTEAHLETIGDANRIVLDQIRKQGNAASSLDEAERRRLLERYRFDPEFQKVVRRIAGSGGAKILDDRRGGLLMGVQSNASPFAAPPFEFKVKTASQSNGRTATMQMIVHASVAATVFPLASPSQSCPDHSFTPEYIRKQIVKAADKMRPMEGADAIEEDTARAIVRQIDEVAMSEKASRYSNLDGIVRSVLRGYQKMGWLDEVRRADGETEYRARPAYHAHACRLLGNHLYKAFVLRSGLDTAPADDTAPASEETR